jgi:hypothetical protein
VPPLQRDEYVQALVPPKGFVLVFSSLATARRHADAPGNVSSLNHAQVLQDLDADAL